MTREEAVKMVKEVTGMSLDWDDKHYEALQIAIEALSEPSAIKQFKWERDIALSQLEKYGIGFAEKKRDLVEVLRCGECKYFADFLIENRVTDHYCTRPNQQSCELREDDYCSFGERREP